MFGQIKKALGIEGVKIDLQIQEPVKKSDGVITGFVKLTTLRESTVNAVVLKVIEKYFRGRRSDKLIDEYTIGFVELEQVIDMRKEDIVEIPFELPFKLVQSEMDKIQSSNFIAAGLVGLAKKIKGVKSEFRIESEALVQGVKLNPLCKKEIIIK